MEKYKIFLKAGIDNDYLDCCSLFAAVGVPHGR
jgi:hypothetical protein